MLSLKPLYNSLVMLWLVAIPATLFGKADSVSRLHTDLPFLAAEQKLSAEVYYESLESGAFRLDYRCYKYDANGDSQLVASRMNYECRWSRGAGSSRIPFAAGNYHNSYYAILKKTGSIAPGRYKVMLRLSGAGNTQEKIFIHQVDSTLSLTSPLRKDLNQTLSADQGGTLKIAGNTKRKLDRASGKMARLFRSRGLTSIREQRGDKEYISLYHSGWFAGRYEASLQGSLQDQIANQKNQLSGPVTALANTELEGYRSLLSQVRELTSQKKEEKELSGELGLTGNWGNAQPEYSQQENNYYELRGRVETKIHDLPVSIEGYYTTQDRNRPIKGSYIRLHYDADKAKEELLGLIGGFKNRFSQTLSKGKGLEQVYGSYLDRLNQEKASTLAGLKKETGLSEINTSLLDTTGLQQQILSKLQSTVIDSTGADSSQVVSGARRAQDRATRLADSANRVYQKALQQYERLVTLEQQARKYAGLVAQYRNTNYFDSTLGYAQLQDLEHADGATYKQLARKASGLLPEGKVKRFATGLTNLDLGIFPKEVSRYTLSGQQLKGLDLGYDLGFCQVGATYGSTEFAGRDGTLDKYTAYSGRVLFTPIKEQKVNLVYYGYMPSGRTLSQDTFFKNMDLALPSFREPVHIVSAAYEGTIGQYIKLDGEVATSLRNGDGQLKEQLNNDKIAWRAQAEGQIPRTGIQVTAGYEHGGRDFKNSTLPVNLSGTDLLKLGSKGTFFRSFLTLGVEYNHIRQQSFSTTGNNSRWGFEIGTHSKRYPSVALSYKPYTTFRSYNDTLAIPQRPLTGSVWTGRANYQWKQTGGRSWRFSAIYNKSTSTMDTSSYGSNLLQLNINYSTKTWMLLGSAGNMDQSINGGLVAEAPAHMRTTFGMLSGSYTLDAQTNLTGGGDIGVAGFGLSKYGLQAGVAYRLKRLPLTVRLTGRYTQYRLSTAEVWKPVYGGSVDMLWQFKMKLNK